jgi:hypothetical protein
MTTVYRRIDSDNEDFDDSDRVLRRRDDWHLVSTARTLVDIMADRAVSLALSPETAGESRTTAVRLAAERLLEASSDERSISSLRYLASVLGHYRDHVISRRRAGSDVIAEPPEIDADRMTEVTQSVGRLVTEAEMLRAQDGSKTTTNSQHPAALMLHKDGG